MAPADGHPVVLFDGHCNLCSATVRFVLRRDSRGVFRFAPLGSPAGERLLAEHGLAGTGFDSFVLIEGDGVSTRNRAFTRSEAALRLVRRLPGAWPLLSVLRLIPRFLRDPVYDLVARNRYRWFGRRETCMLPTPEQRQRFLE